MPPLETDNAKALLSKGLRMKHTGSQNEAKEVFSFGKIQYPHFRDKFGDAAFIKEEMRLYVEQRDWTAAIRIAEDINATEYKPWPDTLLARGYAKAGMHAEASIHWKRLLAHRPSHSEASQALGRLSPFSIEEAVREAVFDSVKADVPVRFIQVGANDGKTNDPMYKRVVEDGWRGVLIEPVPDTFHQLCQNYEGIPGLVFEQSAIGKEEGEATFFIPSDGNTRIASFSEDHIRAHIGNSGVKIYKIQIPMKPLQQIIAENKITKLDVLCIDAEGFDGIVIQSMHFDQLRPKVIHYEHKNLKKEAKTSLKGFLAAKGYSAFQFYWNTIAVPSDASYLSHLKLHAHLYQAHTKLLNTITQHERGAST